jgi:hypothetical protein
MDLMEIWISLPSVEIAEVNYREGRPSRTDGPMSLVTMEDGGFYLWDGYHRLVERTTKGEELEFKVEHWDGWPSTFKGTPGSRKWSLAEMLPEEDRHVLRKISEWKATFGSR